MQVIRKSIICFAILMAAHWLLVLLLIVAVLLRLDIVIVFPTILPMLVYEGKPWKRALGMSVVMGVVIVVLGLFFFWFLFW